MKKSKNSNRKEYIMSDKEILEVGSLYRHFKGVIYRIINVALDEYENTVIIYKSCLTGSLHTRRFEEFINNVLPDVKRFTKISK